MEGRGLAVDGAGGRPGSAPGELVLADLVRGERGGPRGAAEERDEMGGPAPGGALGPELSHLVVLEVGVAELAQGRPLGAEGARGRRRRGGGTGGGGRAGLVRGHGLGPSLVAAAGRRRPSTFALVGATGKRNLRGRRHGESKRLAFEVVLAGAHEAPGGMAGRRLHAPLRSCSMAGELARVTTRGAREASVRALARCAAAVSAIPACQDRHGRWPGHREPPWILASRCTAGCAGASPGHGRAWQGLAGRTWARREGRRTPSAHRRPAQSPDVW